MKQEEQAPKVTIYRDAQGRYIRITIGDKSATLTMSDWSEVLSRSKSITINDCQGELR